MKYLIIGAGGIGGALGGFLANAGKDVTLIARGAHQAAINQNGLKVKSGIKGEICAKVKACTTEEYNDNPDVAFVCVKGYSIDDAAELLSRCADKNTTVIPLLNIFGTGNQLQKRLPDIEVLDGCIYITSFISAPGEITQGGKLFKIIFGARNGVITEKHEKISKALRDAGIRTELPTDIKRKCFQKYSFISAIAAAGAYFDASMDIISKTPEMRDAFIGLTNEINALATAMGIPFEDDILSANLKLLDNAAAGTTASMQKDLKAGKNSEIDGLVFEPVRLGRQYNVATPYFEKIAAHFGFNC